MGNYIVSALKYRPTNFNSVVGQESITTTLKNAIKNEHLAHAYLFCGPRGVGKTTCARIFAKTINCNNLNSDYEACNECESCNSFNEDRSYNIHELDAASNNSVEDIRNLIDQVRIPPQIGKYSVYIIDEVHMLSAQAFNAFLKTLEEPPAHAIFILATTEKHKIIPTILSRCQIFDFHRIEINDIVKHLEYVANSENINYEVDALTIIAQKSDGSLRDALSMFDQIVSFAGNNITYKSVIENLNVLDYDYYFKLTTAFLAEDISNVLLIFNDILNQGFDAHNFLSGLSKHFRDLMVCKDQKTVQLLEVGAGIRDNYKKQSALCSIDFLFSALNIANSFDLNYKASINKRLHVELALVQLCNLINLKKKESEVAEKTEQTQKIDEFTDKEQTENKHISKSISSSIKVEKKRELKLKHHISSSPSIKDAFNGNLINNPVNYKENDSAPISQASENFGNNKFTQEELISSWNKFTEKIKIDKPHLYSTLNTSIPVLKDENVVELQILNPIQENEIKTEKTGLVNFLKQDLKTNNISLQYVITEKKNEKAKLYTDADKYEHLNKINPNLDKLKQQFNLDFK
ncbi:MAG: DNA polymerase III subunit gamma/tau [Bacteroidales bacterium]|nr:DNA polymerase III subunit gamma/tau [Bacteroidales bacterium]